MTPFELDILLHYYVSPAPHRVEYDNPPIWADTRSWFLREGLLEPADKLDKEKHGGSYCATERAKVLIEHICSLPLPVWRMPSAPQNGEASK